MKWFSWLVGVCLLLANAAGAASTVAADRMFGDCPLPASAEGFWPASEADIGGTLRLSVSPGSSCVGTDALVMAQPGTVDGAASYGAVLWNERLLMREPDTTICCLAGDADSLAGLLNPFPTAQGAVAADGEAPLIEQFVSAPLDASCTSVAGSQVLSLSSSPRTKVSLPIDRQDVLGLVAPAPGAIVVGSLGLGLLGWLRKRSVR